jgi:hypothetical protein
MQAPTNDPVIAKLREAFNAMEAEFKTYTDQEKEEVIKLGGLHVVGTERHESRRIDNQVTSLTQFLHMLLRRRFGEINSLLIQVCREESWSGRRS